MSAIRTQWQRVGFSDGADGQVRIKMGKESASSGSLPFKCFAQGVLIDAEQYKPILSGPVFGSAFDDLSGSGEVDETVSYILR